MFLGTVIVFGQRARRGLLVHQILPRYRVGRFEKSGVFDVYR